MTNDDLLKITNIKFSSFDHVREHIYITLRPDEIPCTDCNESYPTFSTHGLIATYIIDLNEIFPSVQYVEFISYAMLNHWGITENILYTTALENTIRKLQSSTQTTKFYMHSGYGTKFPVSHIHVDCNVYPSYGCSLIIFNDILKKIHTEIGAFYYMVLGCSDVYIVPIKSIPIFIYKILQNLPNSIRTSEHGPDDYLSNQIFYYNGK